MPEELQLKWATVDLQTCSDEERQKLGHSNRPTAAAVTHAVVRAAGWLHAGEIRV